MSDKSVTPPPCPDFPDVYDLTQAHADNIGTFPSQARKRAKPGERYVVIEDCRVDSKVFQGPINRGKVVVLGHNDQSRWPWFHEPGSPQRKQWPLWWEHLAPEAAVRKELGLSDAVDTNAEAAIDPAKKRPAHTTQWLVKRDGVLCTESTINGASPAKFDESTENLARQRDALTAEIKQRRSLRAWWNKQIEKGRFK